MSTWYERLDQTLDEREKADGPGVLKRLGKALNQDPSNISHYRAGRRRPGPEVVAKLCTWLDISADWLLGLDSPSEPTQGEVAAALVHLRRAVGLLEDRMSPEELEAAYRQLEVDAQQTGRPSTVNEPGDSYEDRDR